MATTNNTNNNTPQVVTNPASCFLLLYALVGGIASLGLLAYCGLTWDRYGYGDPADRTELIQKFLDGATTCGIIGGIMLVLAIAAVLYLIVFAKRTAKKNLPVLFYKACTDKGITDLSSRSAQEKAKLIAQQLKVAEGTDLEKLFEQGKIDAGDAKAAAEAQQKELTMAQLRKEETQCHKELTKYAELLGREKRIKMLKDSAKEFRAEAAKARQTNTALISATQQKEHDWATHGGIASAIAGPAAGVARAVELQAKNAEIRAQNQANMRMVAPAVMAMSGKASDYERYAQEEEAAAKEAETKLVDDTIPADELLSKIVFSDTTVEISDTGAFTVKVHAKKKEDLFVYDDTPATVDGTIAAELEQNGKVVGTALLVLPSYGVRNSKLTGICLSGAKKGVDYKVNFKPYHLWMMEI